MVMTIIVGFVLPLYIVVGLGFFAVGVYLYLDNRGYGPQDEDAIRGVQLMFTSPIWPLWLLILIKSARDYISGRDTDS